MNLVPCMTPSNEVDAHLKFPLCLLGIFQRECTSITSYKFVIRFMMIECGVHTIHHSQR